MSNISQLQIDPLEVINEMRNNRLKNYIVPGLDSVLIGGGENGTVRMFESSRNNAADITPHSHRFNFSCLVLNGRVTNRIWVRGRHGDQFVLQTLKYAGAPGEFEVTDTSGENSWVFEDAEYKAGEWYSMTHKQIHSIYFSRNARVLFFEGPTLKDTSQVLLPWVDGDVCDMMDCSSPWMYKRG